MNSSDFRHTAREKLEGKWGKAAFITFIYYAFFWAVGFVEGIFKIPDSLTQIVNIIIQIPAIYGLTTVFLKLFNGEETSFKEFFTFGFGNFSRSWKIQLQIILKMLLLEILLVSSIFLFSFGGATIALSSVLYSSAVSTSGLGTFLILIALVLFIVSGILLTTKAYFYKLAVLIGIENPNFAAKKAVEKSEQLMTNNRMKFFMLDLSFIGWAILSCLLLGIGFFWLIPYIMLAEIAFYKYVSTPYSTLNISEETYNSNNNSNTVIQTDTSITTNTFDDVLGLDSMNNKNNSNNNNLNV